MFYVLFCGLSFASLLLMLLNKNKLYKYEEVFKVFVVTFLVMFFLNLFLPDGISFRSLNYSSDYYSQRKDVYYVFIRWLNDLSFVIIPLAFFYKRKTFIRMASFILPISFILNVVFEFKYIELVTKIVGGQYVGEGIMNLRFFSETTKSFFVNKPFREGYFLIMMLLEGISITYILLTNLKILKINNKKDLLKFVLGFLGLFLTTVPIYAPQQIIGYIFTDSSHISYFTIFKPAHIAWLIYLPIQIFVLYKIMKKLDSEERYIAVLSLAFALFYQFHEIYTCFGEITTTRYPFQLCNIASSIILISLIFKNERIFRFTLVVNTLGAVIACIMCDSSKSSIWYIMNVHYIVEHAKILIIPYLASLLGVFKPLDKRAIKDVIITFSIYFLFIFVVGGFLRGTYEITGNDYFKNNYLFMFNKEATVDIVSFVGPLFDLNFKLFGIFYVNLLEPLIYLAFLGLSVIMFYSIFLGQQRILKNRTK